MELVEYSAGTKLIGIQTIDLLDGERLRIGIVDGENILNYLSDADYTVQINVVIIDKQ